MQLVEEYGLTPEEFGALESDILPEEGGIDWLAIAKDAYDVSDDYFGSTLAKQVEKNLAMFNSRHASGSKYNSDAYKFRSKIFRPKTRSSIRRHEAAAVEAYFASEDIVLCDSENEGNPQKSAGAHIAERLLNFRLKQPSFMWFQTCLGAYQDAMVQGVVISRQEWKYREEVVERGEQTIINTLQDASSVDLVPIEYFRFDPNSDWRDPINDSPYLIEKIPMYRGDVKAKMTSSDKDPSKLWYQLTDEQLSVAGEEGFTSENVRSSRTDNREDAKDTSYEYSDFDIIWVHRNIIRADNTDYIFYTLGTTELLSEPIPLYNVYPQGRPYVIGFSNIETHKCVPAAYAELVSGIQQEINEIANQRLDNVKLVVNRRSFVRRNAKIDTRAMTRSVPGGVVLVDDINQDVRYDAPPDVTSSSYAEQDRLNNDFDELAGSFSGSSVGTNRNMNETVGGMEIMTSDASSVSGYQLRMFAETWVKPVLRQLLVLEQTYLSDLGLLMMLAPEIPPKQALAFLQDDIKVKINVGFGATSPARRIEKLSMALQTVAGFVPGIVPQLNEEEIIKEVFGALGYQDGKRFLKQGNQEDPRIKQLEQQLQQAMQMLQGRKMELDNKLQVENMRQQAVLQREQIRGQTQMNLAQLNQQIEYIDQQIAAELNEVKIAELQIQREAFEENKKMQEYQAAVDRRNSMAELLMKNKYGLAPGVEERKGPG